MLNWILLAIIVGTLGWMGFNYIRVRRAAKVVDNAEFGDMIRQGQLIDLRDPADFRRKHILGARNIPSQQLKTSLGAIRKDKTVLLYEKSWTTCDECSYSIKKTRLSKYLHPLYRTRWMERKNQK